MPRKFSGRGDSFSVNPNAEIYHPVNREERVLGPKDEETRLHRGIKKRVNGTASTTV